MPDQLYCVSCQKKVTVNNAEEIQSNFKAIKDGKKHKCLQGTCPKCNRRIFKPL